MQTDHFDHFIILSTVICLQVALGRGEICCIRYSCSSSRMKVRAHGRCIWERGSGSTNFGSHISNRRESGTRLIEYTFAKIFQHFARPALGIAA
jgi:hypothetical protein